MAGRHGAVDLELRASGRDGENGLENFRHFPARILLRGSECDRGILAPRPVAICDRERDGAAVFA